MGNKFEQIAEKKKQAALAKQEEDVARFAKKVADQVLANVDLSRAESDRSELQEIISGLSTAVAGAVVLSNEKIDLSLKDNFTQLLSAVQNNKPDNTSLVKLNREIGKSLAKFETALQTMEFAPEITVAGLTEEQLKKEIDKILGKLPSSSKREVSLAYEKANADKYINVRLTDGIKFYTAFAAGGTSGGEGKATEAKQDDIIDAIGTIGATTNYTTRIVTVGVNTYIGNAAIGASTAAAVWQIKRLATPGLTKLWADGNDSFDNVWDNYGSLSYS